tara:strand:+ start:1019 stop:2182 length:1164 start_codon:yes stop_codon:yes gene_type:complete
MIHKVVFDVRIQKPDDSRSHHETVMTVETINPQVRDSRRIDFWPDRNTRQDAIFEGMASWFLKALKGAITVREYSAFEATSSPYILKIRDLPIVIQKTSNKYYLNNQYFTLKRLSQILSRVTYKSVFEKDTTKLLRYLNKQCKIPADISYVLENRVPYFFYENFNKIVVRLNVTQIGDDTCAIEVGDGIWGEISFKNLQTYCNFYMHGSKRGSWKYLSPQELYRRTVGKEPVNPKVLIEFLKQNRQGDIVEKRAMELLADLEKQYPDRIKIKYGDHTEMYVRGNGYDWKLTDSKYKSEIQNVTTFVWQPVQTTENEEDGTKVYSLSNPSWRGPICIDNMTKGSSTGDQFAARALALLNDNMTIKVVNTLHRYLNADINEYRVDWDAL